MREQLDGDLSGGSIRQAFLPQEIPNQGEEFGERSLGLEVGRPLWMILEEFFKNTGGNPEGLDRRGSSHPLAGNSRSKGEPTDEGTWLDQLQRDGSLIRTSQSAGTPFGDQVERGRQRLLRGEFLASLEGNLRELSFQGIEQILLGKILQGYGSGQEF